MKTGFLTRNVPAAFDRRWLPKALLASPFVFVAAFGASIFGGAQPAYSVDATVSVWNILGPIGLRPNASVADVGGLTGHVNTAANPLTIATVIQDSSNLEGTTGLIFWNPVTNMFLDYGGLGGILPHGIDINLTAPTLTGTPGTVFGIPHLGRGILGAPSASGSARYLSISRVATTSAPGP
jgi:hypothetical protein